MRPLSAKQNGLTLIEVAVVLAIATLIGLLGLCFVKKWRTESEMVAMKKSISTIMLGMSRFYYAQDAGGPQCLPKKGITLAQLEQGGYLSKNEYTLAQRLADAKFVHKINLSIEATGKQNPRNVLVISASLNSATTLSPQQYRARLDAELKKGQLIWTRVPEPQLAGGYNDLGQMYFKTTNEAVSKRCPS